MRRIAAWLKSRYYRFRFLLFKIPPPPIPIPPEVGQALLEEARKSAALSVFDSAKACIGCGARLLPSGGFQFWCPKCRAMKRDRKHLKKVTRREAQRKAAVL
jgi:predicted RNA-binding Zn-ribbon protein involved in translation (DUF1610 family)